jgi:hypothetical protein
MEAVDRRRELTGSVEDGRRIIGWMHSAGAGKQVLDQCSTLAPASKFHVGLDLTFERRQRREGRKLPRSPIAPSRPLSPQVGRSPGCPCLHPSTSLAPPTRANARYWPSPVPPIRPFFPLCKDHDAMRARHWLEACIPSGAQQRPPPPSDSPSVLKGGWSGVVRPWPPLFVRSPLAIPPYSAAHQHFYSFPAPQWAMAANCPLPVLSSLGRAR